MINKDQLIEEAEHLLVFLDSCCSRYLLRSEEWECIHCKSRGKNPDKIQHKEQCLVSRARVWIELKQAAAAAPKDNKHTLKMAFELYEKALDLSCTCNVPEEPCRYCGTIARARGKAESVIGDYEQH